MKNQIHKKEPPATLIHWSDTIPYPTDNRVPEGISRICVHRGGGEFPFLHDTSITVLGGKLFMAWYQCTQGEIEGQTQICGSWSEDGGLHWSEPELVIGDNVWHYVPAVFYEAENGNICGLVTCMTGHDRPDHVVELKYERDRWIQTAEHVMPFLFNTTPIRLPDGSWIAGGRSASAKGELPLIPGVVKRNPGNTNWELYSFLCPWFDENVASYPETALLVCEDGIHAVVRCDNGPAYTYYSGIEGEAWQYIGRSDLPAIGAKWYGGTFPEGGTFLLFNEYSDGDERTRLVLLTRKFEEKGFSKRYVLAEGIDESIKCGPWWHYPSACILKDTLYVSCTSNQEEKVRNAVCIRISLKSLQEYT